MFMAMWNGPHALILSFCFHLSGLNVCQSYQPDRKFVGGLVAAVVSFSSLDNSFISLSPLTILNSAVPSVHLSLALFQLVD